VAPRHPRYGGKAGPAARLLARILVVLGILFGVFAALWAEIMPTTFNWI
jgi:hypothetical protein